MTNVLTRRRFLSVSAAGFAMAGPSATAHTPVAHWRGTALGAGASLNIAGLSSDDAAPLLTGMQAELMRLENIFSLYRAESELCQLNATGRLRAPSPDLLTVLATCARLNLVTEGAFDPSVQPVFAVVDRAAANGGSPTPSDLAGALEKVGWHRVAFDAGEVRLPAGSALTLNGIAQGYITDRIAEFLMSYGLTDILVDMGEVATRGVRDDGTPWRVGVANPHGILQKRLQLSDRALATSAPKGTVLDPQGHLGHIFDPADGRATDAHQLVSVSAPTAMIADGLSTALCILPSDRHEKIIGQFPDTRIELAI